MSTETTLIRLKMPRNRFTSTLRQLDILLQKWTDLKQKRKLRESKKVTAKIKMDKFCSKKKIIV